MSDDKRDMSKLSRPMTVVVGEAQGAATASIYLDEAYMTEDGDIITAILGVPGATAGEALARLECMTAEELGAGAHRRRVYEAVQRARDVYDPDRRGECDHSVGRRRWEGIDRAGVPVRVTLVGGDEPPWRTLTEPVKPYEQE
jgi:hypothetical protein